MRVSNGEYFLAFQLTVPDLYPADPPVLKVLDSNFPERLVNSHVARAEDIIARCAAGVRADTAVRMSTTMRSSEAAGTPRRGSGPGRRKLEC